MFRVQWDSSDTGADRHEHPCERDGPHANASLVPGGGTAAVYPAAVYPVSASSGGAPRHTSRGGPTRCATAAACSAAGPSCGGAYSATRCSDAGTDTAASASDSFDAARNFSDAVRGDRRAQAD